MIDLHNVFNLDRTDMGIQVLIDVRLHRDRRGQQVVAIPDSGLSLAELLVCSSGFGGGATSVPVRGAWLGSGEVAVLLENNDGDWFISIPSLG